MQVCQHCQHVNEDNSLICAVCYAQLDQTILTLNREEVPLFDSQNRFGTAEFSSDTRLILVFPEGALRIMLAPGQQILLGRDFGTLRQTDRLINPTVEREIGLTPSSTSTQCYLLDLAAYGASEMGVSRRHATITPVNTLYDEKLLVIEDLNSTNGTWVSGSKLIPSKQRLLRDGDQINLSVFSIRISFELSR